MNFEVIGIKKKPSQKFIKISKVAASLLQEIVAIDQYDSADSLVKEMTKRYLKEEQWVEVSDSNHILVSGMVVSKVKNDGDWLIAHYWNEVVKTASGKEYLKIAGFDSRYFEGLESIFGTGHTWFTKDIKKREFDYMEDRFGYID